MQKVLFYRTSDEYGCFSNFSNHPIIADGTKWRTVEHYFQASKFLDDRLMFKIQMTKSPMDAAQIGRDKANPLRSDWEQIKDKVMRKAVEAKVRQNQDVKEKLLSTGDALIVEHTSNDSYWGDGGNGQGKNMLGRILMEVRGKIRLENNEAKVDMLPPWEKFPQVEPFSIGWSMGEPQTYLDEWSLWVKSLDAEKKALYIVDHPEPEQWKGFYQGSFEPEAMERWLNQIDK